MKVNILLGLLSLTTLLSHAQNPVEVKPDFVVRDGKATLVFDATIERGWHVYSVEVVENGPTPASLTVERMEGLRPIGGLKAAPRAVRHYEDMFGTEVYYHEDKVTFTQDYEVTGEECVIEGFLEYGACNDVSCIPPTSVEFGFRRKVEPAIPGSPANPAIPGSPGSPANPAIPGSPAIPANPGSPANPAIPGEPANTARPDSLGAASALWAPVKVVTYEELVKRSKQDSDVNKTDDVNGENSQSPWHIFLLGLLGGLVALVTPCVWPIIPMTVSYFLKNAKAGPEGRRKGVKDAIIYGISIIVIYLVLGLIVTAVFGANALNALSTNAVFNIFFFLLLVFFALSFFGFFEITLPSSWSTKVDKKADDVGGFLGIFLMAFTLTLVSFSCTGPIIGFLLVEVSSMSRILGPAIGMFGFALALALPFALFAMFPGWLRQMPKSGNWMNTVKVVLAFIELFFALKFLSVADMAYQWHILDREVFLIIWILIALALSLYLVGVYHFPNEERVRKVHWVRWVLGICSFAFALYMIPGLWGNNLKAISAFTPPMSTQHWRLVDNEVKPQFHDYEEGMAYAKTVGKPVLIDFTGYGCVNCRKMEATVWTDPDVQERLTGQFVLIQLFVDDKTPLDETVVLGDGRKLRTVGDKWSYLQSSKFGAQTQPFYVILDHEGRVMDGSYSFDEEPLHFLRFLNDGLNSFYPSTDEGH
ncbi:MAG: thioredoxin family protein [Bacteroidaceae bacterium]|nr:thioredoxin family protein [Bacteroidaceae bacterium]